MRRDLARGARGGDALAIDRLICANLRFVVSVAKKYQHHGIPLADLIDEGNLGLIRAAHRFDETRGVRFISYAIWWVRQAIVQAIAEYGHAVRVPMSRFSAIRRVGRHADFLRKELGREPTQLELIQETGISDADAAIAMHIARSPISLDSAVGRRRATDRVSAGRLGRSARSRSRERESLGIRRGRIGRASRSRGDGGTTLLRVRRRRPDDARDDRTTIGVTRERFRQIRDRALSRLRKSNIAPALATLRGA